MIKPVDAKNYLTNFNTHEIFKNSQKNSNRGELAQLDKDHLHYS